MDYMRDQNNASKEVLKVGVVDCYELSINWQFDAILF